VRLSDPGVKFRILKCGKNLKQNPEYRHVYLNEDLTVTRSTIEVLRLHKRWIGLSGRGQEGVFGANIVYFTCIVLQTYFKHIKEP
jgi:hypothetical protein